MVRNASSKLIDLAVYHDGPVTRHSILPPLSRGPSNDIEQVKGNRSGKGKPNDSPPGAFPDNGLTTIAISISNGGEMNAVGNKSRDGSPEINAVR